MKPVSIYAWIYTPRRRVCLYIDDECTCCVQNLFTISEKGARPVISLVRRLKASRLLDVTSDVTSDVISDAIPDVTSDANSDVTSDFTSDVTLTIEATVSHEPEPVL